MQYTVKHLSQDSQSHDMVWGARQTSNGCQDLGIFIPKNTNVSNLADFRPIKMPHYFLQFWLRGSVTPLSSAKNRGRASIVHEIILFSSIPSFAVNTSNSVSHLHCNSGRSQSRYENWELVGHKIRKYPGLQLYLLPNTSTSIITRTVQLALI